MQSHRRSNRVSGQAPAEIKPWGRIALAASVLFLAGCSSAAFKQIKSYDPAADARLRVYWGPYVTVAFNQNCQGRVEGGPAYRTIVLKAGPSWVGGEKARTLGMPLPEMHDKYFAEYAVPANVPILIGRSGGGVDYRPSVIITQPTFDERVSVTLQPGKDYETHFIGGTVTVRELVTADGAVSTRPLPADQITPCPVPVKGR